MGNANNVITLKSYIYLDEVEIESLFSQLYPDVLKQTTAYSVNKNANLTESINGSLMHLIGVGGSATQSADTSLSGEIQTKMSIEYKTNVIIQHVCDNRLCSLYDIIAEASRSNSLLPGRIIAGYAGFYLTAIYDPADKLIELENIKHSFTTEDSTFILESGDRDKIRALSFEERTDCYNDYVQSKKYGIEMHLGGKKIRREVRHLTTNIKGGKVFNLSILGQLSYAGINQYYIKPFAIW